MCVFVWWKRRKLHGNLDKISSNSQVLGALVRQQARSSTHHSVFDGCFRSQKSNPPKCSPLKKHGVCVLILCIIRYVESLKTKPFMKFSWNSMKQCTSSFNERWNSPIKSLQIYAQISSVVTFFSAVIAMVFQPSTMLFPRDPHLTFSMV